VRAIDMRQRRARFHRDGGFIALGRNEGIVPPHHHAIQIVIAVEGASGFRASVTIGGWLRA